MSIWPREISRLRDAIDLYRNPGMAALRADRPLWMGNHYPLVRKYHERVLSVAAQHDQGQGALRQRLSKLSITFDDLTKE